ncbi:MAG: response regulator transcription factor [Gammaproteobacteria bacterium]
MDATLKVLIADDHGLVREGLKHTLTDIAPNAIALEAANADEVRSLVARQHGLDLILLDLRMPGVSELELLDELCSSQPGLPVVVLSASDDVQLMQRAIERGAAGFIPKSASHSIMVAALRLVLSGGVYIPPAMIGHRTPTETLGAEMSETRPELRNRVLPVLTKRQRDVLRLLGEGRSNKAIARELGLSEHTVKIHISAIFKALDVANRTEAALISRTIDLASRQ